MSARWTPTQAELLEASSRTAAAIAARPSVALADVERAAELEEAVYAEVEPGPCDRVADPPPLESRIDWTPELDSEVAAYEAELEAAL